MYLYELWHTQLREVFHYMWHLLCSPAHVNVSSVPVSIHYNIIYLGIKGRKRSQKNPITSLETLVVAHLTNRIIESQSSLASPSSAPRGENHQSFVLKGTVVHKSLAWITAVGFGGIIIISTEKMAPLKIAIFFVLCESIDLYENSLKR